jgi:ribonuclease T
LKFLGFVRIRGYLPVVIDIETGGFNDKTDAMLEICAITIDINEQGVFYPKDVCQNKIINIVVDLSVCPWQNLTFFNKGCN